jgi:hypothetical protein
VVPLLGACATGANPGPMTAELSEATLLPPQSRLRQAVAMGAVTGGRETNPIWTSQVSDTDFAEALRRSLTAHAMLAASGGRYRLDAQLVDMKQPLIGLDLEVSATVDYRLVSLADGTVVFAQRVPSRFTAGLSSAMVAVVRLRLANEGAIRENIRAFLAALVAAERANPQGFAPLVSELLPELRRLLAA